MEKKIAVKVSNQQEYDAFRKHCEEVGYYQKPNWKGTITGYSEQFHILTYENNWLSYATVYEYLDSYEIISFPTFAKLKGIEMPKNEVIIETTFFDVKIYKSEVQFKLKGKPTGFIFTHQEITEIYTALKSLENE